MGWPAGSVDFSFASKLHLLYKAFSFGAASAMLDFIFIVFTTVGCCLLPYIVMSLYVEHFPGTYIFLAGPGHVQARGLLAHPQGLPTSIYQRDRVGSGQRHPGEIWVLVVGCLKDSVVELPFRK